MKIIDCKQGEPSWFAARCGVVSASEVKNLITDSGEPRKGKMPETYLYSKLAERWTGEPHHVGGSFAMEQGSLREGDPLALYEFETGVKLERVGFILADGGQVGCSPDGINYEIPMGYEVKSPYRQTHLEYLLRGEMPPEYMPQVQCSMLVTGYKAWTFVSFAPRFPVFRLTVPRDEEYIQGLWDSIEQFNAKLERSFKRLVELNGGPPKPREDVEVMSMAGVEDDALAEFMK